MNAFEGVPDDPRIVLIAAASITAAPLVATAPAMAQVCKHDGANLPFAQALVRSNTRRKMP
jgi:hypothetical protein